MDDTDGVDDKNRFCVWIIKMDERMRWMEWVDGTDKCVDRWRNEWMDAMNGRSMDKSMMDRWLGLARSPKPW